MDLLSALVSEHGNSNVDFSDNKKLSSTCSKLFLVILVLMGQWTLLWLAVLPLMFSGALCPNKGLEVLLHSVVVAFAAAAVLSKSIFKDAIVFFKAQFSFFTFASSSSSLTSRTLEGLSRAAFSLKLF